MGLPRGGSRDRALAGEGTPEPQPVLQGAPQGGQEEPACARKMFMSKADWGKGTGVGRWHACPPQPQPSLRDPAIRPHNAYNHGKWLSFPGRQRGWRAGERRQLPVGAPGPGAAALGSAQVSDGLCRARAPGPRGDPERAPDSEPPATARESPRRPLLLRSPSEARADPTHRGASPSHPSAALAACPLQLPSPSGKPGVKPHTPHGQPPSPSPTLGFLPGDWSVPGGSCNRSHAVSGLLSTASLSVSAFSSLIYHVPDAHPHHGTYRGLRSSCACATFHVWQDHSCSSIDEHSGCFQGVPPSVLQRPEGPWQGWAEGAVVVPCRRPRRRGWGAGSCSGLSPGAPG